ncbi:response regulator [Microvirga sp. M2]|uniref:phosphorylase family protein n=1 Tax=Microvirga sp. M2 TaxID=3073270 RepID=UPI0039C2A931
MVKVLIVDDNQSKLSRVISSLTECGISRNEIDVAQSGADARSRLEATVYDLMILDIALPYRPEDQPDRRGGIDLLEEVLEREIYKKPSNVIGLTGFADLREEFDSKFSSQHWTLEHYDEAESGWIDRLRARATYIVAASKQHAPATYGVDVAIITALPTELAEVRRLSWAWGGAEALDNVSFFYRGEFTSGDRKCSAVCAAAPRMGMVSAALVTMKIIEKFRPKLLIMTGICAGFKNECDFGDVLLAERTWDWQMGKYTEVEFQIAPDQLDVPTEIVERFQQLQEDKQLRFNISDKYSGNKPNRIPDIKIGPVVSGSAVLADQRLLTEIKTQHRKLLGVEMEQYGVYLASKDCSSPRPIAIGLKGVSDFADKKKDNKFQGYAAHMSAGVMAAFCERYGKDLLIK